MSQSVESRLCEDVTCYNYLMNAREPINEDVDESFNGAELSESVLARDWNSPEEEAAWSNL
jgi:hypothetical protein